MADVVILYKDDSSMVVQLSSKYSPFEVFSFIETKAVILNEDYIKGVELHRVTSGTDSKNEQFNLTEAEMDALTAAWEEHRATQALKKLQEETERATRTVNALCKMRNLPGAVYKEHVDNESNPEYWTLNFNGKERVAYGVGELETEVNHFVAQYEADLAEKAWNEEAQIILSQCPEIQVSYYNAGATPFVSLNAPFQYAKWTRGAEEFLSAVKEARNIVHKHAQSDDVLRVLVSNDLADAKAIKDAISSVLDNVIMDSIRQAEQNADNNTQPLTEGE